MADLNKTEDPVIITDENGVPITTEDGKEIVAEAVVGDAKVGDSKVK